MVPKDRNPSHQPALSKGRDLLGEFPIPSTEGIPSRTAPVLPGTLTQGSADEVELIRVRPARPQGHPREQLGEHAANGPHVHGGPVLGVPHQQLRGPVPPGGHVVGVVVTGTSWVGGRRERHEQGQGDAEEPSSLGTFWGTSWAGQSCRSRVSHWPPAEPNFGNARDLAKIQAVFSS